MSKLTKCDICGYIYDDDTIPSNISVFNVVAYSMPTGRRHYNSCDCCPKCTIKLEEFVDSLKIAANILNKE